MHTTIPTFVGFAKTPWNKGRLIGCGTLDTLRHQADLHGTLEDVFLKLTEEETREPTVLPAKG